MLVSVEWPVTFQRLSASSVKVVLALLPLVVMLPVVVPPVMVAVPLLMMLPLTMESVRFNTVLVWPTIFPVKVVLVAESVEPFPVK